jgi:hypothetical protein
LSCLLSCQGTRPTPPSLLDGDRYRVDRPVIRTLICAWHLRFPAYVQPTCIACEGADATILHLQPSFTHAHRQHAADPIQLLRRRRPHRSGCFRSGAACFPRELKKQAPRLPIRRSTYSTAAAHSPVLREPLHDSSNGRCRLANSAQPAVLPAAVARNGLARLCTPALATTE